ncbi:MAG TPA: chloride channel protein [Halanaerobiales bacterium]|nr:chloride channel protein [Halanaerobiales bacterium]
MDIKKDLSLTIIVLLLGIPAAALTYLFIFIIDNISINIINYFSGSVLLIFIPALGGLIVGLLLKYGTLTAKGHGVPLLLSTIKSEQKGLTKSDLRYEGLATTFTVITGGSVGLVGPIIELTTGITDIIGRYLKFDLKNYQILIGSGAAASFAAVFCAPFAGILFSLEVIHKDWSLKNIFFTAMAAFSGNYFIGFIKPKYGYFFQNINIQQSTLDVNQYIYITIFSFFMAFIGWLFINTLLLDEHIFSNFEMPLYLKPMFGGLLVGMIGYFFIEIMGTSSNLITNLNKLDYTILMITALLLLKIAATGFSIGSGGSGGLFAPMILTGLFSGLLAGELGLLILPSFAVSPVFLMLCGVVGIFGGIIKAPITSVILVLELFYLPNLIIPLIIAGFVPFIILNLLKVRSIYSPELFNKEL